MAGTPRIVFYGNIARKEMVTEQQRREKQRRENFGATLKAFRKASIGAKTKRRLSQTELASRLSSDTGIDAARISCWETAKTKYALPSPEEVIEIANALGLSAQQRDQLLVSAGYAPLSAEAPVVETPPLTKEEPEGVRSELRQSAKRVLPLFNYVILSGTVLIIFSPGNVLPLMFFVYGAYAVVIWNAWRTYKRASRSAATGARKMDGKRNLLIGELMFASLFVMLSTPLLGTSYTGIDMYGFRVLFGLTSAQAIVYCLLVNLFIATLCTLIFFSLWRWQYSGKDVRRTDVTSSTLLVILPPLLLAYVVVTIFGQQGLEEYFAVVFFPMVVAFLAATGYSHPRNEVTEFVAKMLFRCCIIFMVLGFLLAFVGMFLHLAGIPLPPRLDPQNFVWRNLLWAKELSWPALGYADLSEFLSKNQAGFVWMVLTGIFYMELAVGVPTTLVIHRFQLSRFQQAKR